jgi:hypothetical protein
VFNFDSAYFKYFAKNKSPITCTNPQYVALTRCLQDLILIQAKNELPPEFADYSEIMNTCNVIDLGHKKVSTFDEKPTEMLNVTDLLEYLSFDVLHYAEQFYNCTVDSTGHRIELPSLVKSYFNEKEISENVSDINGLLITLINEHHNNGEVRIMRDFLKRPDSLSQYSVVSKQLIQRIKNKKLSLHSRLVSATLLLQVEKSGTTHRVRQISDKEWLSNDNWKDIVKVFQEVCGTSKLVFEQPVIDREKLRSKVLVGRADVIDHERKIIYEIKWVNKVSDVHKIQLLLYYYLLSKNDEKYYDYSLVLVNFKDGKRYSLEVIEDDLFPLVDYFVHMKYAAKPSISYSQLETSVRSMIGKYFTDDYKPKPSVDDSPTMLFESDSDENSVKSTPSPSCSKVKEEQNLSPGGNDNIKKKFTLLFDSESDEEVVSRR